MDTRFKKGHKESPEQRLKRIEALKIAWQTRSDRHGMMGTKFHNSWRSMTTRCRGTAGEDSKRKYRDKGIRVCERWLSFKNFYDDMFPSYIEGMTIDRIENSKGYYKENCRWATPLQQCENREVTVKIFYNDQLMTLRSWALQLGVTVTSLRLRYHRKYKKGIITLDQLMTYRP